MGEGKGDFRIEIECVWVGSALVRTPPQQKHRTKHPVLLFCLQRRLVTLTSFTPDDSGAA